MAESRENIRFREDVIGKLSAIETSQKNMLDHLLKLNGEMVATKGEVERLKIADAKRSENDRLTTAQQKFVYGLLGSSVSIALMHFSSLIGPWFK